MFTGRFAGITPAARWACALSAKVFSFSPNPTSGDARRVQHFWRLTMEKRKSARQQQDLFAPGPERLRWTDLPVAYREKTQNLLAQLLSTVLKTYNIETPIQENRYAVENNL
jgi:hypothetical protein